MHKMVRGLMTCVFQQLLGEIRRARCDVVFGSFTKIIVATGKKSLPAAVEVVRTIQQAVADNPLFSTMAGQVEPANYWAQLVFLNQYNYAGMAFGVNDQRKGMVREENLALVGADGGGEVDNDGEPGQNGVTWFGTAPERRGGGGGALRLHSERGRAVEAIDNDADEWGDLAGFVVDDDAVAEEEAELKRQRKERRRQRREERRKKKAMEEEKEEDGSAQIADDDGAVVESASAVVIEGKGEGEVEGTGTDEGEGQGSEHAMDVEGDARDESSVAGVAIDAAADETAEAGPAAPTTAELLEAAVQRSLRDHVPPEHEVRVDQCWNLCEFLPKATRLLFLDAVYRFLIRPLNFRRRWLERKLRLFVREYATFADADADADANAGDGANQEQELALESIDEAGLVSAAALAADSEAFAEDFGRYLQNFIQSHMTQRLLQVVPQIATRQVE